MFTRISMMLFAAVALSGCGVFAAFQDRIGSAVGRYCEEPIAAREALREYINVAAAPNSVYIACEGDTPPDDETVPAETPAP